MKKLITLLCVIALLMASGCNKKEADAVIDDPVQEVEVENTANTSISDGVENTSAPQEEVILGGWEERVNQEVTEELLGMFNKGVEGTEYEGLVPVKLLATQVVSGMNFKFLCDNDQELVIYQDLDGNYFALNADGSIAEKAQ